MTTGTAELLRIPEVQRCIKSDFLLLPCDLICDIPGELLLETWMVSQSAFGGSTAREGRAAHGSITAGTGGEQGGRRGGLGLWYQTQGREESVKGEVTDFLATTPLEQDEAPAVLYSKDSPDSDSLRFSLSKVLLAAPMDTMKERMDEQKGLLVRHSLVKKHSQLKMLTTYRDAHAYIFPYWVKEMARLNEKFQSVSEDLVGWWAKSGWQTGLGDKLQLRQIFEPEADQEDDLGSDPEGEPVEEEIDLEAMSTTKSATSTAGFSTLRNTDESNSSSSSTPHSQLRLASRARNQATPTPASATQTQPPPTPTPELKIPPMLAYIHSSKPTAPLIRRIDNSAILLSVSLRLAKLESIEEVGRAAASPFAHAQKVAYPAGLAQRCTVTRADCLLADNVTVEEKSVIKESVVGPNCHIAQGSRLTRCLVMDGAVVGERCQLTGCIVGRRSKVGRECVLKECEVQDGNVVADETDAKSEKFMIFEGLEEDEEMEEGEDGEDGEGMGVSGGFEVDGGDNLGF